MSDDSTRPHDDPADAVAPPPASPPSSPDPDDLLAAASPSDPPVPEGLLTPPPASDAPVPEGLLTPPPADIPPADAVIPPPPADIAQPATRSARRRPAVLSEDAPSAVADDWARPSVAPQDPDPGSYRGLAVAVFAVLVLLLVGAIAAAAYLATSVGLPFAADAFVDTVSAAATIRH